MTTCNHHPPQPMTCPQCWDAGILDRLREAADTAQLPPHVPDLDCVHRGEYTGETVRCVQGCKGVMLKTFGCALHQRCTLEKQGEGVQCCRTCLDRKARFISVNHTDFGMGDSLLGLCATKALKLKHPDQQIIYKVPPNARPFVSLFDGYDYLDHCDAKGAEKNGDLQINADSRFRLTRLERYLRNLGVLKPAWPLFKDDLSTQAQCKGATILAPFSRGAERTYPLERWLLIEQRLVDSGHSVLIADLDFERCRSFVSPKMIGQPAPVVTATVQQALMVVSCESGLAHLAGVLKRPAVVVCSATTGERIHSGYPESRCVQEREGKWPMPQEVLAACATI